MTRITGDWISRPATQAVFDALAAGGHGAWFVGGCVRNALMGQAVADVDIATDATPETVARLAEAAGLRPVPTGVDHGTVTVVSNHQGYEVTTFRRDVETDGRRAVVAFSTEMREDALRRDFTMNALYADRSGKVVDPLGQGLGDLDAGRVRFIENAEARIREDYLRILRFFRFVAWYGHADNGMDPDALAAIAANSAGLETLSRERVGHEMLRLLAAPDPSRAVAAMAASGVLRHVLAGADATRIGPFVHAEERLGLSPDRIARLAALGGQDAPEVLRLSRADAGRLATLTDAATSGQGAAELGYRLGAEAALSALALRSALLETEVDVDSPRSARFGAGQVFPVRADDLMPGVQGPAIGQRLRALEAAWIASDFSLTRDELLARP